jgi:hypothetical protein
MDQAGTSPAGAPKRKGVDLWMIAAIVAIVIALIAGYLAFTYKQQVDDWQTAADETVAKLEAAGVELRSTVESGVDGYEQQISDQAVALEAAETQGGISEAQLLEAQQQLAEAQAELESTRGELDDAQQELAATQAELDDANAKLEQLGELVLPNGTYVGPVLGARAEPIPAIVFQDGTAWRVAEVAPDVAITAGGREMTLEEFSALLQSTDPADVELANGPYEVVVKKGLVTTIRTAET